MTATTRYGRAVNGDILCVTCGGVGTACICEVKPTLPLSDYAMQHPDHYALRATSWQGGRVIGVELALMDLDWNPIDEGGCNCDLDSPCNNPRCVMEREGRPWR